MCFFFVCTLNDRFLCACMYVCVYVRVRVYVGAWLMHHTILAYAHGTDQYRQESYEWMEKMADFCLTAINRGV